MENNFEQISKVSGFMLHNGGLLFRNVSDTEFEFKSTIQKIHLNRREIKMLIVFKIELTIITNESMECLIGLAILGKVQFHQTRTASSKTII